MMNCFFGEIIGNICKQIRRKVTNYFARHHHCVKEK